MKKTRLLFVIMGSFLVLSCSKENETPVEDSKKNEITLNYNFQENAEGWIAGFADYLKEENSETFYKLKSSHKTLPPPLDTKDGALMISGHNYSDDLFMYFKKQIKGLEVNKTYQVSFEIEIASNAAKGLSGVGGAPGEGVTIKAGASTIEPIKILDKQNNFRMNIDKGNQGNGGANAKVIGNFANGTDENIYTLKSLKSKSPVTVKTNSKGELWLIVCTDSGFEAKTTIYYNSIKVNMK